MNRYRAYVLALASLSLGVLLPAPASAASLVQVTRSEWAGSVQLPSYMQMYIYVPDNVAAKPPIMISAHSCGSTATGQMGNIPLSKAAADRDGFILILPDNPSRNCWDVGTTPALTHDGGGDTHAVAQMVKYTIGKYNADPGRVYVMGGSGGAMLVQGLLAVYPDVFRAGMARAGVAAGCWADMFKPADQWSDTCAGGNVTKSAQQWGDLARAMFPGYTGHRPRLQMYQGDADTTVNYKNMAEAIKQWTNVLSLPSAPTSTDMGFKAANNTYNRQFWKNACGYTVLEAWISPGKPHSMPYEEADMLKFFGLDALVAADPEPNCTGSSGGAGGMGGIGAGGMGAGGIGAGGIGAGGVVQGGTGGTAGSAAVPAGSGGVTANGGSSGTTANGGGGRGGVQNAGGTPAGLGGGSGTTGSGGTATGGSVSNGGSSGTGVGGTAVVDPADAPEPADSGCGCIVGGSRSRHTYSASMALGLALLAFRRRQRRDAARERGSRTLR